MGKFSKILIMSMITLGMNSVYAGSATGTMKSSASIAASCNLSTTNIAFGTYNPTSADSFANGALTFTCTKGIALTVGLNRAADASDTVDEGITTSTPYSASEGGYSYLRTMTNGSSTLQYNIFQDSSHTQVFGGPNFFAYTANSQETTTATGSAQTVTMYGAMSKGQYVVPGTYVDSVQAVITY